MTGLIPAYFTVFYHNILGQYDNGKTHQHWMVTVMFKHKIHYHHPVLIPIFTLLTFTYTLSLIMITFLQ